MAFIGVDFNGLTYEGAFGALFGINSMYKAQHETESDRPISGEHWAGLDETNPAFADFGGTFPPDVGPTQTLLVLDGEPPRDDEDRPTKVPVKGTDWSLDPFQLILRGVHVPVLGALEVVVRQATNGVKIWFSWLYRELGYSSALVRLRVLGIRDEDPTKLPTGPSIACTECFDHFNPPRCEVMDSEGSVDKRKLTQACSACFIETFVADNGELSSRPGFTSRYDAETRSLVVGVQVPPRTGTMREWVRSLFKGNVIPANVCGHRPEDFDDSGLPEPTTDGLALTPGKSVWRGSLICENTRCCICNTSIPHGWNPKLFDMVYKLQPRHFNNQMFYQDMRLAIGKLKQFIAMIADQNKGRLLYITATSSDRPLSLQPQRDDAVYLVITDALAGERPQKYSERPDVFWFVPPALPDPRYLSGWRYLAAVVTTEPIKMMIINAKAREFEMVNIQVARDNFVDAGSYSIGHTWPCFMGSSTFQGGTPRKIKEDVMVTSFIAYGWIYGWDEIMPLDHVLPVIHISNTLVAPGILAPLVHATHIGREVLINYLPSSWDPRAKLHRMLFKRANLYYIARLHREDIVFALSDWFKVLADPRPIEVRKAVPVTAPSPTLLEDKRACDEWPAVLDWQELGMRTLRATANSASAEHSLAELSLELGGIFVYTFGTKGDNVPLEAIVSWLRARGTYATLVRLNTEEEGKTLLKVAVGEPTKQEIQESTALYQRARRVILNCTGLAFAPASLGLPVLTYDLAPPKDKIFKINPTGEVMLNIAYQIMSIIGTEPVKIGAYWRPGWVPRSSNGVDFLEAVRNTCEIEQIAAWGSDGVAPAGFEGVPQVEPGDHVAQFRRAKLVLCHGGAGTVQTAASCGARVVSLGSKLDRAYRDPYDAGQGVTPGAPPDRILLALARADKRFLAIWLRANWLKPWQLTNWLGMAPFGYFAFRLLMLYLVYKRVQASSVVSTDPMTTLFMVVTRWGHSWKTYAFAFLLARTFDQVLENFKLDYPWLLRNFLSLNLKMSESIIGMFLAQRYNIASGLAWAAMAPRVTRALTLGLQTIITWTKRDMKVDPSRLWSLEWSFTTYWGVPVFHTALVKGTERYEGSFITDRLYVFKKNNGGPRKWKVTLPTSITDEVIDALPSRIGSYGVFWNCQTGLLVQLQDHLSLVGPSLGALLATSSLAAIASTMMYAGCLVTLGLTSFLPMAIVTNNPRARLAEAVIASSVLRVSAVIYNGTVLTPVALLDWTRSLITPFVGGHVNTDYIQGIYDRFDTLSPLYRVDPVTVAEYKRELRTAVLAGNSVLDVALFEAHLEHTTTGNEEFLELLRTFTIDVSRRILAHDLYYNLHYGVTTTTTQDLYQVFASEVPISWFGGFLNENLGKEIRGPDHSSGTMPLSLSVRIAYEFINDAWSEAAHLQDPLPSIRRACDAILSRVPRKAIKFALVPLMENGAVIPSYLSKNSFQDLVRGIFRHGIEKHIPVDVFNADYQIWRLNVGKTLDKALDSDWKRLFAEVFPNPPITDEAKLALRDRGEVIITGEIVAALKHMQVPNYLAEQVGERLFGSLLKMNEGKEVSMELGIRKWLWKVYLEHGLSMATVPERLSEYLVSIRKFCQSLNLPFTVLNSLANLATTIGLAIYNVLDKLIEIIVGIIETSSNFALTALTEYMYLGRAFLSLFLPERRRRPKAVWALLFANDFSRLTEADKFIMSCQIMREPPQNQGYDEWADKILAELERTGLADIEISKTDPVREVRYPLKVTTVLPPEIRDEIELFPPESEVPQDYKEFVDKWVASGVPQGVTGMYFATPERVEKSIRRYDVIRPDPDEEIELLIDETVDAMVEHYPHLYRGGKFMTPRQAIRNLKLKYSPGLPFIGTFKSRREFAKHGMLEAIAQVAENRLREGIHPGTMAHAFVKDQVVDLSKLLKDVTEAKNLRTVTAQDVIGNVTKWTTTLASTRAPPREEDYVMNAVKHTEGGFRAGYDAVRRRKHVFQADATEFDSKLAPVITVRGLARLRAKAFEGQFGQDVLESQIRANYLAMRFCKIRDLQYGREFGHTGGLLTGQSDTAPDNKDAFRMMVISMWSYVIGRPPSKFWDTNTLINAGDDDAIGTDDPLEVWEQILQAITDKLGVVMRLEAEGFENLSLTALRVRGVPAHSIKYYVDIGMAVPDYAIDFEEDRLLHRKTEFTFRNARLVGQQFKQAQTLSIVGSAWLTAHQPHLYADLAHLYTKLVSSVLLRYYEKVDIRETFDEEGVLVALSLNPSKLRKRYDSPEVDKRFRGWLRGVKFPTYRKIMEVWLAPNDLANSRVTKTFNKIQGWIPAIPWADRITFGLIQVREALYEYIPNHVVKPIEFRGEEVTYIMRNQDYVVAKFVWLSLLNKHKKIPTDTLFRTALRECPYASAEDPVGFLDWLSEQRNLESLIKADLEEYRGQMATITVVYFFIEKVFKAIAHIPYLGWLVHLFAISTRDINRVYAALNYLYMLSEGRSSVVISNLMPNDPYAWIKQFSVILSCIVPTSYHRWPGLKHVVKIVPMIVELWAAAATTAKPNVFARLSGQLQLPNDWLTVHARCMELREAGHKDILVVAPTATGKSTAWVGALDRINRFYSSVWILCPTVVSAQEYTNPFVDQNLVQILSLGVINNYEKRIKVATYGHFLTRLDQGEVAETDLLLLDELHLMTVEQVATWYKTEGYNRIAVTATPTEAMPSFGDALVRYPGTRRFEIDAKPYRGDWVSLWQLLAANNPELLTRALIVAPTLQRVREVITTLGRLSIPAYELSADNPVVPPSGVIVATTIVDVAITIAPPPTVLIDLGQHIKVELDPDVSMWPSYTVKVEDTPPSVHTQRLGRVGRLKAGQAFYLGNAGKGTEPIAKPTPASLLAYPGYDQAIAATYGIRVPLEVLNPALRTVLRFVRPQEGLVDGGPEGVLALAFYIFYHASAGLRLEEIRNIFNNHRLNLYFETIQSIVLQEIQESGYGNPFMGDFDSAVDYLTAGSLEIQIGNQRFPSTCLVNRGNTIILPPNLDPRNFVDEPMPPILKRSWRPHRNARPIDRATWIRGLIDAVGGADQVEGEGAVLIDWNNQRELAGDVVLFGSAIYLELYNRVAQTLRFVDVGTTLLPLQIEGLPALRVPFRPLHVRLHTRNITPGAMTLNLMDLNIGPISPTALAWLIAVVCPDDRKVIYGDPADFEGVRRLDLPFGSVLIHSENVYRSGIVAPTFARRHAHALFCELRNGSIDTFIATLPHQVYVKFGWQEPIAGGHFQYFTINGDRKIEYI